MKTVIQKYGYYKAKIKYHRTDDLRPKALPDGSDVHVNAVWIAEEGERFEGDMIFSVAEDYHNLPQRDLIIGEQITHEAFLVARSKKKK